jgi:uncharacterized membrane protein
MKTSVLSLIGLFILGALTPQEAIAKRSGGRSSSGSMERAPAQPPVNRPSQSQPSNGGSGNSGGGGYYGGGGGYYGGGGGYYGGGTGGAIGQSLFEWIALLGLMGLGTGGMMLYYSKQRAKAGSPAALMNDKMTLSQIQVGFYATDCQIQKQLAAIVETLGIDTEKERLEQLQAVTLAVLRQPQYWSHVKSSSEVFKTPSEAQAAFNRLSMGARSKYDEESLTRREGQEVKKLAPLTATDEDEPSAYVVVTLLVGSTHDEPLFETIHGAEGLRSALEKLSGMTMGELRQFELIWTPQDGSESLSSNDLLVDFPDLQLV